MSTQQAPAIHGVIETVLYTADMTRARDFFETVLGLSPHNADQRFTAYPTGHSMLLVFQQGQTDDTVQLPDGMGTIPPHDGGGRQHVALAIERDALADWEAHLARHDVAIEGRTHWPPGGESLYFRDPDGHLLELVTPGLWPNY
ncbi:VOC family protein [Kushneria indalinina]|uniref:Glyoxalase/bleomycin resistance protein/dioxygenase superfamily protein n=1 Tax=Kushneria indalinina DSM 14324 TaxID=1122140 RepID=A0A3D9DTH5_9GAMM|nr:VOC family protein [Kushneria indalinina]REC94017.1 glyoxalase/bleomycin resistance protein/dioxygenase superfamily protein [Kushneria indalinina DSM 14324]